MTFAQTIVEPLYPAQREPAPPLPKGQLNAEAVPPAAKPGPVPLIRILIPVIMVAAMLAMVALMMLGGASANPMFLIFPLMMGMSMLMMFSPPQSEDINEARRVYLRHLAVLKDSAESNAQAQRAHELHRHPAPSELWMLTGTRRLWERGGTDEDALEVRVGMGTTSLITPVQVPDSGATEDLDPVCAVMLRRAVRSMNSCPQTPVAVQLQAFRFFGLSGPGAQDLARAIIAQLVVAHGPEAVSVEIIGPGWDWCKWLPHCAGQHAVHRIVVLVAQPTTGTEAFIDDPRYTTIIDVDARTTTAVGMRAEQEGLCLLVDASGELFALTTGGVEQLGTADVLREEEALHLARCLSGYTRPGGTEGSAPGGELARLLGVNDLAQLTPAAMWPGREGARERLVVAIGADERGHAVRLDLKEAAHGGMGPHGLCIGATGSGKSELLRTLVVALAATHSPEELNLVLVDFKGGATFLGVEGLPHTSAVITNLAEESILVERMFDAIFGELNRRQELLRQAGNFANVHDYTAARLAGRSDLAPLPAVLIVVDEFSELLSAHPDFADLFVAVGRLGRSLHVHLLLASQRLEEGRLRGLDSHLSYRIGLRTFSAAESRQVLGVPDAHHLPSVPGAGYMKFGAEELVRFQASYVSGPLRRKVVEEGAPPPRVQLFRGWAQTRVAEQSTVEVVDESTTLLGEVVSCAQAAAAAREMSAHRVWLPPLPPLIELAGVADDLGFLKVSVGIVDLPYLQRQDPLVLDLNTGGGHVAVCGGPQSGKSTALRTLVISLSATHDTAQVGIYVIDLGGGQLAALDRLPHVAGVADRQDVLRMRRVVEEVLEELSDREAGEQGEWKRHLFVVIDGWQALMSDFEELVEGINRIAADGPSVGIHLVLSAARWSVIRPVLRDLIVHRVELKLGEAMDSLFDRAAQQRIPVAPGRGITAAGEHMLIAHSSPQDIAHVVHSAEKAGMVAVPSLRVLPAQLSVAEINPAEINSAEVKRKQPGILLGVGGPRLNPFAWDFDSHPHLICIGGPGAGKSQVLRTIAAGITQLGREKARMVVLDHRRSHLSALDESMVAAYCANTAQSTQAIKDTVSTMQGRLPGPEVTPEQLGARSWWSGPEIFVLIDDLELIPDALLHPLLELLPHARDIGLHVVVARKSGGVGRALFAPFLAALKDGSPAVLLLSADKEEGPVFGIKPMQHPPGRGTWQVRGSTYGVVQVGLA